MGQWCVQVHPRIMLKTDHMLELAMGYQFHSLTHKGKTWWTLLCVRNCAGHWGKQETRSVVSCSIGADNHSRTPFDFSWRDIKKGQLLSTSARKDANETKGPTKVHLGKPMRLLQVTYRSMGDSKAASYTTRKFPEQCKDSFTNEESHAHNRQFT